MRGDDRDASTSLPARWIAPSRLIVNPSAGAGRAARLLPGVEAALRRPASPSASSARRSIEHARELARAARDARRGGGRDGRRRARRRGRGRAARRATACWRCSPAGAATTSRASSGSAATRSRRRRPRDRPRAPIDLAEAGGRPSSASSAPASTPTCRRSPTRTRLRSGTLVYLYGALRALRRWRPAHWEVELDGAPPRVHAATRWRWPTPASSAAACGWRPTPSSTTACSTSSLHARQAEAALPTRPHQGVQRHPRRRAEVRDPARPRGRRSAPTARSRLRRRRPDRRPPGHGEDRARRLAGDRAVRLLAGLARGRARGRRLARAAGRGAARRCPGKVLMRAEPHAIARLAARLPRGSVVISATNGKTTTAAMVAAILERTGTRLVHNRAGANMAGGVAALPRSRAAAQRRRPGPVRGRRVLARPGGRRARSRARCCSATCSATSSTATASSRSIADRWAAVVGGLRRHAPRAQRRRPAGRRPRARTASAARTSASRTTRWRCPSCSTPPTPSTAAAAAHAYVYEAVYLGHLGRYHCPNCGARRPEPEVAARDVALRGIRSARVHAAHAARRAARRAPPPRALQRLQRARRGGAVPAPRRAARRGRRRPGGRRAGLRPRGDDRAGRPPDLDPAGQEPGRRQRGAAHARARGRRSSTCSACSTTASPTAATSPGCGTPTSSCSPPRVRADHLRAARARRSWRCA